MKTIFPKFKIYIDEAGRGPFAGPLYVGVVLECKKLDLKEFKDSKKCTEKHRDILYDKIVDLEKKGDLIKSLGVSTALEIDKYGLSSAMNMALNRGLFQIFYQYFSRYILVHRDIILQNPNQVTDYLRVEKIFAKKDISINGLQQIVLFMVKLGVIEGVFFDGNKDFGVSKELGYKIQTIVDGDDKIPGISCASILAKVSRDRYMINLSGKSKYKKYGFEKHKGYGTKFHIDQIKRFGISDQHRKLFLKTNEEKKGLGLKVLSKFLAKPKVFISNDNPLKTVKTKLLLHVCCAPDLTWPLDYLKDFDLYVLWYNPNITDEKEYNMRFAEYLKLLDIKKPSKKIIKVDYNKDEYYNYLFDNKNVIGFDKVSKVDYFKKIGMMPEQTDRCLLCYMLRLEKTAAIAVSKGFKYFSTTLSISPKKDFKKLIKAWEILKNKYQDVEYISFDFKKDDGYLHSLELTKKYGIWRQNYCGCEFSKR